MYDEMNIDEIEQGIDDANKRQAEAHKEFLDRLYYLRKTGRFRENKSFKKAKFAKYLKTRWNISISQFDAEIWATSLMPIECERLGIGTVVRARAALGSQMTRDLLTGCESLAMADKIIAENTPVPKKDVKFQAKDKAADEAKKDAIIKALREENEQLREENLLLRSMLARARSKKSAMATI